VVVVQIGKFSAINKHPNSILIAKTMRIIRNNNDVMLIMQDNILRNNRYVMLIIQRKWHELGLLLDVMA
jgi:hypothetical protein